MLSGRHHALVELLRGRPQLLLELALGHTGIDPDRASFEEVSADLTTFQPQELRADLVLKVRDRSEPTRALGLIVEVQLATDDDKTWVWPHYVASLRHRLRCPVVIVVVAPDARVAAWARRPLSLTPDTSLTPWVIGPENVGEVHEPEQAAAAPERALLSALAHRRDATIVTAVCLGSQRCSDQTILMCVDALLPALDPETRATVQETLMSIQKYEWQSDFAKKYVAQGLEQGLEQGIERGREQGLEQGLSRACALLRGSIRETLTARGISIDEETLRRLDAQTDLEILTTGHRIAATANHATALWRDDSISDDPGCDAE